MYEIIFFLNIDEGQFPKPPSLANRKKARVNISNFAFCEWVLLPSRIRSAVAATTIMPLDLCFLRLKFLYVVLNKDHRLLTI